MAPNFKFKIVKSWNGDLMTLVDSEWEHPMWQRSFDQTIWNKYRDSDFNTFDSDSIAADGFDYKDYHNDSFEV